MLAGGKTFIGLSILLIGIILLFFRPVDIISLAINWLGIILLTWGLIEMIRA